MDGKLDEGLIEAPLDRGFADVLVNLTTLEFAADELDTATEILARPPEL